jgi:hypothetical protein
MKKKTKKKWFFTVVEEAIFGKGLEDYIMLEVG